MQEAWHSSGSVQKGCMGVCEWLAQHEIKGAMEYYAGGENLPQRLGIFPAGQQKLQKVIM